jgi:CheY-like chemotaxis protein
MGVPVLIVDDDELLRPTLRMLLEEEGYQVFEAPDGKPALERLRESADSMVVVLDYNMPGMDGRQLLEAIAQHDDLVRRHALILATATYTRTFPLAFVRLLQQLNVQVVAKPFDLDELLAAVQQAADRLEGGTRPEPG